jgi:exosome complex component RRP40
MSVVHFDPSIVIPGDCIPIPIVDTAEGNVIVLGPGLSRKADDNDDNDEKCVFVVANRAGVMRHKKAEKEKDKGEIGQRETTRVYWVDSHAKRYVPARGENVIGVVVAKGGDIFRVDIGSADHATLSFMAFEGATKKNRPNVNVGDVVYAKLLVASRDMEPELVCVDAYGKKAGLGQLSGGGFMFSVPLNLVRKLLSTECELLSALGKKIKFEIAVGMNGRVWVKARSTRDTICLANAICAAEYMTNEEIKRMVSKLSDAMHGF